MTSTRDASRRKRARLTTLAGVGGILLIVLGIVLTVTHIGGYLFPTILALAGMGSLLAGIGTGFALVMDNFRYSRDQSYYDPDDGDR